MARECRFSCDSAAFVVRIITLLGHCASMVAGGWGFIIANQRNASCPPGTAVNCAATMLTNISGNYAIFQGLAAVYFIVFGFGGICSEIRTKLLQRTILSHVTFLTTYFGRATLCVYVGSLWIVIPWDDSRDFVSKVPGGLLLGMGAIQFFFFIFVKKERKPAAIASVANPMLAAQQEGEAAKIAWGAPGPVGGEEGLASPSTPSSNGINHSQSRMYLLPPSASGTPISNPVHPSFMNGGGGGSTNAASFAPTAVGGGGTPASNPFLAAQPVVSV